MSSTGPYGRHGYTANPATTGTGTGSAPNSGGYGGYAQPGGGYSYTAPSPTGGYAQATNQAYASGPMGGGGGVMPMGGGGGVQVRKGSGCMYVCLRVYVSCLVCWYGRMMVGKGLLVKRVWRLRI